MMRMIGAVAAGLLLWVALEGLLQWCALLAWLDYAAAAPTRNFDLPMLVARLLSGAGVTLLVGTAVARASGREQKAIPVFALILLLLAVAHHLQPLVWSAYPLWYHLVFWAYLVPLTLLGGRLASARKD